VRDERGVRNSCGFAPGNDVDIVQPDIRFGFLGQLGDDVLALGGKRQQFAAIDINRRDAAGDKNEGFVFVDGDGLSRKQHLGNFFRNFAHEKYPFRNYDRHAITQHGFVANKVGPFHR
jgi:hypothetical protein